MLGKISEIKTKFDAMPWQKQVVAGVLTVGVTVTTIYFAGKGFKALYDKMTSKKQEKELTDAISDIKKTVETDPELSKIVSEAEAKIIDINKAA